MARILAVDDSETIQHLVRQDQNIPILALTSENEKQIRAQGATAGANGWIIKPFRPAQLLDIVGQIV